MKKLSLAAVLTAIFAVAASAQVTPAAGYTPPDDTPKVNVGITIFGDYTFQDSPNCVWYQGFIRSPRGLASPSSLSWNS